MLLCANKAKLCIPASFILVFLMSCSTSTAPPALNISPGSAMVLLGKTTQFTASASVSSWTVNGVQGGSAGTGTISSSGLYTAPIILPSSPAVTIGASSGSSSASVSVTIQSDISVSLSGVNTSGPILTSSTLNLTATVNSSGAPSTAVSWSVGGVPNGNSEYGTIVSGTDGRAVYTAPAVQPSGSIQIVATSVADPSKSASANQAVQAILLSQMTATPGSVLTLTGNFNTNIPVLLTFSDGGSYNASFSVNPDSTSQATLVVPLYPSSSGFGQGTVSVSATQQSTIGTAPGFVIEALPTAAGSLGSVTLAALKQLYATAAEDENLWIIVGAASGGKVATAGVASTTSDIQTHLLHLIGSITQVANGGSSFSVGTTNGSPMEVNASALALMDAIYQAFVINNPGVQNAISSLPAQTLARLHVPATTRTPEDNLRAFAALGAGPHLVTPIAYIGSAVAILGAIVTGAALEPVALYAAVAIVVAMAIDFVLTPNLKAIEGILKNTVSALSPVSTAEADETAAQTAITDSGATLAGDEASLLSDLQNLNTLLDPSNANSPGDQANNDQPTLAENAPTAPSSTSTPTLSAIGYTIPATGEILVNIFVHNAPPGVAYTVMTSWSDTESLTSDPYGYGFGASVTPVPTSGTCYQGTVTLQDADGRSVSSVSGCFGSAPLYGIENSDSQPITIVDLEQSTGKVTPIYTLPSNVGTGLSEGALDASKSRFFLLVEGSTSFQQELYTIDLTGVTSPLITQITNLPAMWGMQFNSFSGFLYGTESLGSGALLISLDPSTGNITPVYTFPFLIEYAQGTVDAAGKRYYQIGEVGPNSYALYSIDLTGAGQPQITPNLPQIYNLVYDPSSGLLYGIEILSGNAYALVSLDPSKGTVTSIYSFPAAVYPDLYGGALDAVGRRYFQTTYNQSSTSPLGQLYTIDLTGSISPQVTANFPAIQDLSY